MIDQGHLANVLTWRLDRLSRNLSDLILLADRFGQAGVALHGFTEKIDLSSATGRMFCNILSSFAQFYREQLAENVRMPRRGGPLGRHRRPLRRRRPTAPTLDVDKTWKATTEVGGRRLERLGTTERPPADHPNELGHALRRASS